MKALKIFAITTGSIVLLITVISIAAIMSPDPKPSFRIQSKTIQNDILRCNINIYKSIETEEAIKIVEVIKNENPKLEKYWFWIHILEDGKPMKFAHLNYKINSGDVYDLEIGFINNDDPRFKKYQ